VRPTHIVVNYLLAMADRQEIPALYIDDRDELLSRLGLKDAFDSGLLRCRRCARSVNEAGLGTIRIVNDEVQVECRESSCTDDTEDE